MAENSSLNVSTSLAVKRTECVGSATGNPRNKCALKPGHSLLDWIRLGNSGEDLSCQRGRITPITLDELAKHKYRNDAWLAINGQVYNVTRYMDFHPGGVDELMRGVGKDASKLFAEVHSWVNYQQLLQKCRIGPLVAMRTVKRPASSSLYESLSVKIAETVLDSNEQISPRTDWIQTTSRLTLFIYTKRLSNPSFLIKKIPQIEGNWKLAIWILIDTFIYKYQFEFHAELLWPFKQIKVNKEAGKLELSFNKANNSIHLWPSFGTFTLNQNDSPQINQTFASSYMDFEIIANKQFNHDSYRTILSNKDVYLIPAVCSHITISKTNGDYRNYTPVPQLFTTPSDIISQEETTHTDTWYSTETSTEQRDHLESICKLNFIWKRYEDLNSFTQYLSDLKINDIVQISLPKTDLRLTSLMKHRSFCLIAAGSGITPFLSLIEYLLERQNNRIDHLVLLYFNKTFEDIWCLKHFKELRENDERFLPITILTRVDNDAVNSDLDLKDITDISLDDKSNELITVKGVLSKDLLEFVFDNSRPERITFTAICGPKSFNSKTEGILEELEFPSANIHIFQ